MRKKETFQRQYRQHPRHLIVTSSSALVLTTALSLFLHYACDVSFLITWFFLSAFAYISSKAMYILNCFVLESTDFRMKHYISSDETYLEEGLTKILLFPFALMYVEMTAKHNVFVDDIPFVVYLALGYVFIMAITLFSLFILTSILTLCELLQTENEEDNETKQEQFDATPNIRTEGVFAEDMLHIRTELAQLDSIEEHHTIETNLARFETALMHYDNLSVKGKELMYPECEQQLRLIEQQLTSVQQKQEQAHIDNMRKQLHLIEKNTPL